MTSSRTCPGEIRAETARTQRDSPSAAGTGHLCAHQPPCPPATAPDHDAARLIAYHPEQGWGLLCNGVIVFDDTGELLPRVHGRGEPGPEPS
jgi:Family of unknown function (DUF5999)